MIKEASLPEALNVSPEGKAKPARRIDPTLVADHALRAAALSNIYWASAGRKSK
jgi:hypothetical protein